MISSILEQLETLACAEADSVIPASLQPAVQHTLDCIRRPYQTDPLDAPPNRNQDAPSLIIPSQNEAAAVGLDEAWQYLGELLCEQDSWAAGVGQTWLYNLLTEAANQHLTHLQHRLQPHMHPGAGDFPGSPMTPGQQTSQQVGLLPHPLGGPPKPDSPAHLTNQPELAQLLRQVLCYHTSQVTTGTRFMAVIKRFLLHLKLKCSLLPDEAFQQQHGPQGTADPMRKASRSQSASHSEAAAAQPEPGMQEDLSASAPEPSTRSMRSAQSMPANHSGSAGAGANMDPLTSLGLHPHLLRTSPALSWGKSNHGSAPALEGQLAESDEEEDHIMSTAGSSDAAESSLGHQRTQSDPRGLLNRALSAADVSLIESHAHTDEARKTEAGPGRRADSGHGGAGALSNVLSTSELSGLLSDRDQQAEGGKMHEGVVLHDAPVLGQDSLHRNPRLPGTPAVFQTAFACNLSLHAWPLCWLCMVPTLASCWVAVQGGL